MHRKQSEVLADFEEIAKKKKPANTQKLKCQLKQFLVVNLIKYDYSSSVTLLISPQDHCSYWPALFFFSNPCRMIFIRSSSISSTFKRCSGCETMSRVLLWRNYVTDSVK